MICGLKILMKKEQYTKLCIAFFDLMCNNERIKYDTRI